MYTFGENNTTSCVNIQEKDSNPTGLTHHDSPSSLRIKGGSLCELMYNRSDSIK